MPDLGKRHKKYYRTDSNNSGNKLLRAVFTSDTSVSITSFHSHNRKRSWSDRSSSLQTNQRIVRTVARDQRLALDVVSASVYLRVKLGNVFASAGPIFHLQYSGSH